MIEQHKCKDCLSWEPTRDLFHDGCSKFPPRRIPRAQSYELRPCHAFQWNPENSLTEHELRVLEALKEHCRGERNAAPAPAVGSVAGLQDRDGRATREIISQLRRKGDLHGVLIASGPKGFYIPATEEESLRCLQTLQSREEEASETRSKYEALHKERWSRRSA